MYQVKTVIQNGAPAFIVKRFAPNFKSSVTIGTYDNYATANEVKEYLEKMAPIEVPNANPNQLTIEDKPKNGK